MSFIVKGIDLPKDGESIRLVITSSGDVVEVWRDGLAKAYHPCQAVQIPKGHGRIGDMDGVIKQIDESPTFASKYKGTARLFIDVYSDSNTILEAEEK